MLKYCIRYSVNHMRVVCLLTLHVVWKVAMSQDSHHVSLLLTLPAFEYKSFGKLIYWCLSNAGAHAVYKVS